jgi:hypothetical protein
MVIAFEHVYRRVKRRPEGETTVKSPEERTSREDNDGRNGRTGDIIVRTTTTQQDNRSSLVFLREASSASDISIIMPSYLHCYECNEVDAKCESHSAPELHF